MLDISFMPLFAYNPFKMIDGSPCEFINLEIKSKAKSISWIKVNIDASHIYRIWIRDARQLPENSCLFLILIYQKRTSHCSHLFIQATTTIIIIKGEPGGLIYLQLKSLKNLNSKNFNGICCGSSNGTACNQLCGNFQFDIWIDCDSKRNGSQCSYGYINNVTFDSNLEIKKNFIYNFTLFAVSMKVLHIVIDNSDYY